MNLNHLLNMFASAGCKKVYAKPLAEHDNSKNQVYFGPGFQSLNLFPTKAILPDAGSEKPSFKAKMDFGWLLPNGKAAVAPGAQLILYPQYPEVRFSGFLRGCPESPSELMASRLLGRVLFLGVVNQKRVIGYAADEKAACAVEFKRTHTDPDTGVFHELTVAGVMKGDESRRCLLDALEGINKKGWIKSKQLGSDGRILPCNAPQCGGFTLEAELGTPKNSSTEPDFLGWEIKQHAVTNFEKMDTGTITLMTPEPNGGFYREQGVEAFVRKFGYPDKHGRTDRFNFGGVHRVGKKHPATCLTLILEGYDPARDRITDSSGKIALVNDAGNVAASWAFNSLLEHWARKHSKAAYVPSQSKTDLERYYHYGHTVRLAQQTDSLLLLQALTIGAVYYDPGIKLEKASSAKPKTKRRSQFRIASKNIDKTYKQVEKVSLNR